MYSYTKALLFLSVYYSRVRQKSSNIIHDDVQIKEAEEIELQFPIKSKADEKIHDEYV